MSGLRIGYQDWLFMKQHVEAEDPLEACGFLGAENGFVAKVIPVENISSSGQRFRMHPAQQVQAIFDLEARGLDLAAIYHSHPFGGQEPSVVDLAEWHYREAYSLIWSKLAGEWICNAFELTRSDFVAVEIQIINGEKKSDHQG